MAKRRKLTERTGVGYEQTLSQLVKRPNSMTVEETLEKLEKESTSSPSNEFVKSKQIRTILSLTQSEYDALEEKDGGTMYLIVQDTEEDTEDVAG